MCERLCVCFGFIAHSITHTHSHSLALTLTRRYGEGKWLDAIKCYSESLKRHPGQYKVYSNRAACEMKMAHWQGALEDLQACLNIEPTFVKAYIRLGKVYHVLKRYDKAMESYDKGLLMDPKCTDLIEGRRTTENKVGGVCVYVCVCV
jgi:tetratricopeptide (TPR) repeat protein